jgi:hypothetical protein
LDELVRILSRQHAHRLYVRWSPDILADLSHGTSRDELTGIVLPGLSANDVTAEPWWADRSLRMWVARKLYDYRHIVEIRGPGTMPWLLEGTETSRGPDNEPLITECGLVAAIDQRVIDEAVQVITKLPKEWGSLRRR